MTTIAHGHTPGRFGSVRPGGSLMARGPNERYLFLKSDSDKNGAATGAQASKRIDLVSLAPPLALSQSIAIKINLV